MRISQKNTFEEMEFDMVIFEEDPDIRTEEGYGTEDIDVVDTEAENEVDTDPDMRTEEGYGNIDPNRDTGMPS